MSKPCRLNRIVVIVFMLFTTFVGIAQNLQFVDLGVVEGEFRQYDRVLTWTNQSSDSVYLQFWSSNENLKFTPLKRSVGGGELIEIPISIALPEEAGDLEYELRLLDDNNLVLHGFQMSFKVLQSELDVFKAYRNVHFPFRTKEEVLNLRSGVRGDTLSAFFDVYNLGGQDLNAVNLNGGDSVHISFSTDKVAHHAFSKMRIDFISNSKTELGFQKRVFKFYNNKKLVTALPVQYTILPKKAANDQGPNLNIDISSYDFKVMNVGSAKEVEISVANNGNQPLVIEKVESNCDCLMYNNISSIAPGSSQILKVVFNATGRMGLERKTLAIFSNDPLKPVQILTFRAHVK